jgi:hypothetical protein
VQRSAQYVSDRDKDKRDGAEQYSLNRTDDGTGTGYVYQVEQSVSPILHRGVVYAVVMGNCRSSPVIGAHHTLTDASVYRPANKENYHTN